MTNKDDGRSPPGRAGRPTDQAPAGLGDTATIPSAVTCPNCGTDLHAEVEALLPEQTEITLTLHITPGELCMAETVGATIVNFAKLQEEVAKALDCEVSVFMAGLKYENDVIYLTFRMANRVKGKVAKQSDMFSGAPA